MADRAEGTIWALSAPLSWRWAIGCLFRHEARVADPLLPLSLFAPPHVRAGTLPAFLFYFIVNGLLFFTPLYLQGKLGYSPFQSGLGVLPMGVVVFLSYVIAPKVLARHGQRPLLVGGLLLIALGGALWVGTPLDGHYWAWLFPGIVIMSVGQGFAFTSFNAAALTGVSQRRHGVAGALNVTAQQAGAAIGTATMVTIAATAAPDTSAQGKLTGITWRTWWRPSSPW
ncbi:MFS transporter [Streptomyces sp. NPDC048637]|uniref:MFS transporter n=1 Tax=Streptomyces sp. NPDC048637 TaxID=3155636 RepID=UPI00341E147D